MDQAIDKGIEAIMDQTIQQGIEAFIDQAMEKGIEALIDQAIDNGIGGPNRLMNIELDRPHDYSKQNYNASRDQPSIAAKPWQKLTKRKYPFVLLP